jgi:ferrous iron transport protein B
LAALLTEKKAPLIALVGNPNAGKTTVFNALTGAHQKVGNYPGVTVERVSAFLDLDGKSVEFVDVPGVYSLDPVSEDERIATEVIRGTSRRERPVDLFVIVIDATNLERNLFLLSHVRDLGRPMIAALTMTDMPMPQGATVDVSVLESALGMRVVPVVGHKGHGVDELKEAVAQALAGSSRPAFEDRSAAYRCPKCASSFPCANDVAARYSWAAGVCRAVLKPEGGEDKPALTDKIDRIVLHKVWGLIVFFGLMYLVFQSIYAFAEPLMNGVSWCFDALGKAVAPHLARHPMMQSMVVDGIIGGVGTVVTFLPQILILFFFVALLEGTGYLARAAFLMDRVLSFCGLNGRAFIPLLSCFACAVPGIMAARVMPDPKSRLATILVSPLMSCSARLPIYLLVIGAFIEPIYGPVWAGVALFGMHLVGLAVAIPTVWIINRGLVRTKQLPFLLELPAYQTPKWRDVVLAMYFRGKVFLKSAGTIIFVMSMVVWGLLFFPRSSDADQHYRQDYSRAYAAAADRPDLDAYLKGRRLGDSYMGTLGKEIEPVFKPAGFDWRLSTSILAAFPAREVVVSSMGIMFDLGGEENGSKGGLRKALERATWPDGRKLMTPWTAVSFMVFFALCCQCMATLAAIRRETNSWKWPVFVFTYMSVLAYLAAVGVQQLGRLLG